MNTVKNYAGFVIGGNLPLTRPDWSGKIQESTAIKNFEIVEGDPLMQVYHVTTERGSLYELHVVK